MMVCLSRGFVKFFTDYSSSICTKIFCSNRLLRKLRPRRPCAARCLMGAGNTFAVYAHRDADYRLCVFLQIQNNTGGVFQEKNFFFLCFSFLLGKIILKSIFDFGIRENKKDETEVPSFDYFYVHALSVAVLLLATACVKLSIILCKESMVVVAVLLHTRLSTAESAPPQIEIV